MLLQRIAFLLYRERKTLNPDQVYLFTPNSVFEHYIDTVLPSMGESNPQVFTWRDFIASEGAGQRDTGEKTSPQKLTKLEQAISGLVLEPEDLREIRLDGVILLKASQVQGAVEKFARFGVGPRFCALVKDELHDRLSRKLAQLSKDDEVQEEMLSLDVDEQVEIFGETISPDDENETADLTRRYLERRYAGAHEQIDRLTWLRFDRIGMRILDQPALSATEWLYLKLLITGAGEKSARYVMVDEVQDYTVSQLMVLAKHFSRAHFLLLGDEHQAINEGTASFAQIAEVFSKTHGNVEECRLLTSYRSSPEITELFCSLLDRDEQMKLTSVHRAGVAPVIREFDESDRDGYIAELKRIVAEAAAGDGLTAIVAESDSRVSWLAKQMDGTVQVLGKDADLPAAGVVLLSLRVAKGLEFDQVIIPDAQEAAYPDTPLSRRRLYTAISRAMHRVTVLSQGTMTPLLTSRM